MIGMHEVTSAKALVAVFVGRLLLKSMVFFRSSEMDRGISPNDMASDPIADRLTD
jgi:hypothetical protein